VPSTRKGPAGAASPLFLAAIAVFWFVLAAWAWLLADHIVIAALATAAGIVNLAVAAGAWRRSGRTGN
jgi:hypothetical protein